MSKRTSQVVVISSLAGHVGLPVASAYSASKFALEGFFTAIRPELAHKGVRVLIVEPGAMDHPDTAPRSLVNQKGEVVAADPTSDR
jgi:short-subunit dehydrogenase